MRIKFYAFSFLTCLLVFAVKSFSQSGTYGNNVMTERPNTPINEMVNGYIEILPVSYSSNPTKKYPLLIFLEGVGQFGDGSPSNNTASPSNLGTLYGQNEGMLPDIVRKGLFPNSYVIGSTTYEFIVIVPQLRRQVQTGRPLSEQMASPTEVNDIINYAFQNYRVDEQRVYLSGLSLGGGSTWNYAGESTTYANRLAAIVPFSGASNLHDNVSRATEIAASNLPVWTFTGGSNDQPYTDLAQDYIDTLARVSLGHTAQELITTYTDVGHNSWQRPLEGGNTLSGGNTGGTTNPSNIYVWMLGKARSSATQPAFATVNAGSDQTLNLSNGSMVLTSTGISFTGSTVTLNATATPASGRTIASTQWVRVNGNGGTITNPNSLSTTVTGLKPGFYTYQLRATDDQGLTTVDAVNITVNAPPENKYMKVEAEAYTASDPNISLSIAAIDQGPATSVGSFDYYTESNPPPPPPPAKYVEYSSLSLPGGTGVYALYYRYNSPSNSPVIQISVNGTVVATKTLISDGTWRSDSIHVNLLSTPTTIRFTQSSTSIFNSPWNFNYFELAQINSVPLPVKFIYFNAQCKNGGVALQWKTAQEINSKEFEVQRSSDGINWSVVGRISAAGQSSIERSYEYLDNSASSSNNFYRIAEYDLDGRTTISSIVRGNCSSLSRNEFSVVPNPSMGSSALNVSLEKATKITLTIVDSKGSLMQQSQVMLPQGSSSLPLNMNSYSPGIYNINIRYNSEMKTIKVLKR